MNAARKTKTTRNSQMILKGIIIGGRSQGGVKIMVMIVDDDDDDPISLWCGLQKIHT